jgi:hypothetical protein
MGPKKLGTAIGIGKEGNCNCFFLLCYKVSVVEGVRSQFMKLMYLM